MDLGFTMINPLGVLLLFIVIASFLYQLRKNRLVKQERAKQVAYLLNRIAEAAGKRKTQLYQSLDEKENSALAALKELADDVPAEIKPEIDQIEAKWARLTEQLEEFSDQSVQSTLQSSVLTTRAAMTADEITSLVKSAQQKLGVCK